MRGSSDTGGETQASRHARLTSYPSLGVNSLWVWRNTVPLWRAVRNFVVIYSARYVPFLRWKLALYRLLGAKVGEQTSFALSATLDIFFPELISVGDNTIIGYNTVILAHEYLKDELRTGLVDIGRDVVVGANCTILPGIIIGDGAVVSAHSLVNRDVLPGATVGGVPIRHLNTRSNEAEVPDADGQ